MKSNERGAGLPDSVAKKLRAIQRRAVSFTFLRGVILAGAVLLGAMLAAMLVDWSVGWFNPAARYTFTALALGAAIAAFLIWCARPLLHRRSIVSTAREVDQSLPQLEERWSTVTELSQSTDAPEVRGSEAMIRKVASEAELASAKHHTGKCRVIATRVAREPLAGRCGRRVARVVRDQFHPDMSPRPTVLDARQKHISDPGERVASRRMGAEG
jgi:hypothetical protein